MTRAALLAVLLCVACGSDPTSPPSASPWTPVAGMRCADGSPTGIGISRGRSDAVLVYLSGGGACWSETACDSSFRSFGAAEFDLLQLLSAGTVADRGLAGNPFATWTMVFVPYCTGDVHAGDSVRSYGARGTWQHHGWKNLQAAVQAFTAALPRPAQVVVAGSSAGGFGALAAYDLVRAEWDPAGGTSAALVDDSGPTFVGTAMPPQLLATWWDGWGLDSTIGARCPRCAPLDRGGAGDLSELWPALAQAHPGDRLALVSTTRDDTMRRFFADPAAGAPPPPMDPLVFEAALDRLAQKLGLLGPNVATYRVGAPSASYRHALLADSFFLPGSPLLPWLAALSSGAPWTSAGP